MKRSTIWLLSLPLCTPLSAQERPLALDISDTDTLLAGFYTEYGGDFQSCFAEIPEMLPRPDQVAFDGVPPEMPARLVIAIDGSGSMAGQVGGMPKMEAAQSAARAFLRDVPESVEVGLVAFGHVGGNDDAQREESCAGVEMIAEPGSDRTFVEDGLRSISATGWTPLAAAIEMSGKALDPTEDGLQVVYVVSDGRETCGGDPVAAAGALHESELTAVVNIIGFDLDAQDRAELEAVAAAGGGIFDEVAVNEAEARARARANTRRLREAEFDILLRLRDNSLATSIAIRDLQTCVSQEIRDEQATWNDLMRSADEELRSALTQARPTFFARHDRLRLQSQRVAEAMRMLLDGNRSEMAAALVDLEEAFEAVDN